jgi:fermentation-respiration switch protein FrsA (DUF1100 family)
MQDVEQSRASFRQKVLKIFLSVLFIYVALITVMYLAQRHMLYATKFADGVTEATEPRKGFHLQKVITPDGLELFGWYAPPKEGRPVTVWFHGNGSNIFWHSERTDVYLKNGFGVLMVEYRGYSGNPGTPSEDGLYADADAWMTWLQSQGIAEDKTILYAESLGTGVAVQMAVEYPNIAALILEAPFTSMVDAAKTHYWFVPVGPLLKDRYDNLSKIENIHAPVIVIHGTKDAIIPFDQGRRLYDAVISRHKVFIELEGANHLDFARPEYEVDKKVLSALLNMEAL